MKTVQDNLQRREPRLISSYQNAVPGKVLPDVLRNLSPTNPTENHVREPNAPEVSSSGASSLATEGKNRFKIHFFQRLNSANVDVTLSLKEEIERLHQSWKDMKERFDELDRLAHSHLNLSSGS